MAKGAGKGSVEEAGKGAIKEAAVVAPCTLPNTNPVVVVVDDATAAVAPACEAAADVGAWTLDLFRLAPAREAVKLFELAAPPLAAAEAAAAGGALVGGTKG